MRTKTVFAALLPAVLAAVIFSGCRQRDIRTAHGRIPQATEAAAQAKIRDALSKIDGVETASATFSNETFSVRYDSMKLGLKNIEHAIWDLGYDAEDFESDPKKRCGRKLP